MITWLKLVFHRHKWGAWGNPQRGSLYGFLAYQRRECFECGRIDQHEIGYATEYDTEPTNQKLEEAV